MNIDKERLKALAEAAQAWSGEIGEQRWYEAGCFKQPYFGLPDAEFLTAISPVTVLALIAEIDGLHAQHGRDSGELRKLCASRGSARRERDQLKAENEALRESANFRAVKSLRADCEALRKDAERYQWLCAQFGVTKLPCAIERILGGEAYVADGKASIDAAIDAALAKEVQP